MTKEIVKILEPKIVNSRMSATGGDTMEYISVLFV
jgi:hypothetical protein